MTSVKLEREPLRGTMGKVKFYPYKKKRGGGEGSFSHAGVLGEGGTKRV